MVGIQRVAMTTPTWTTSLAPPPPPAGSISGTSPTLCGAVRSHRVRDLLRRGRYMSCAAHIPDVPESGSESGRQVPQLPRRILAHSHGGRDSHCLPARCVHSRARPVHRSCRLQWRTLTRTRPAASLMTGTSGDSTLATLHIWAHIQHTPRRTLVITWATSVLLVPVYRIGTLSRIRGIGMSLVRTRMSGRRDMYRHLHLRLDTGSRSTPTRRHATATCRLLPEFPLLRRPPRHNRRSPVRRARPSTPSRTRTPTQSPMQTPRRQTLSRPQANLNPASKRRASPRPPSRSSHSSPIRVRSPRGRRSLMAARYPRK
jgi:hypothetical protein